ncbi:MAG: hypothetical protein AAFY84_16645 [Pseudomonadota bacterium]
MTQNMSPLDEDFIGFGAAAAILSEHDRTATREGMLEMLVRALWSGEFNPPSQFEDYDFDQSRRDNPQFWLSVPIDVPGYKLTKGQAALRPRPMEYYPAGRDTILSVMHCMQLLPGEQAPWDAMLDRGRDGTFRDDTASALTALVGMPLHAYTDKARDYFESIYVPRRLLQAWLDDRTPKFGGVLTAADPGSDGRLKPEHQSSANEDAIGGSRPAKRGRHEFRSCPLIKKWALELKAQNPTMLRKELAGAIHEKALQELSKGDVPAESTILRDLKSLLGRE